VCFLHVVYQTAETISTFTLCVNSSTDGLPKQFEGCHYSRPWNRKDVRQRTKSDSGFRSVTADKSFNYPLESESVSLGDKTLETHDQYFS
jgi:hypothetical protein